MTRRILSIDGGGIRGAFPAAFLAELEDDIGKPIGDYFDLISGSSTGGIIAIALSLGVPAREILQLYEEQGPSIFYQDENGLKGLIKRSYHKFRWYVQGPKYSSDKLRKALDGVFGNKKIGHAKTRLMIPAWHSNSNRVYVCKTSHNERLRTDYKESAVDVALATAAAPTYFRKHITSNDVGLVDGGLWANNPAGFAVIEAISVLNWPADKIKLLSVSCLDNFPTMKSAYSALSIRKNIVDFFMAGQSYSSISSAKILTGDPHKHKTVWRIPEEKYGETIELDDTSQISRLKDLGFAEARIQKPILKDHFFTEPAETFVPCHKLEGDNNV